MSLSYSEIFIKWRDCIYVSASLNLMSQFSCNYIFVLIVSVNFYDFADGIPGILWLLEWYKRSRALPLKENSFIIYIQTLYFY